MPSPYFYLALAVILETIGTSALKLSDGFTKPVPVIVSLLGFTAAIFLMSLTLRYLPVGVVYAIWSGLGIVLITIIGYFAFKQTLDIAALLGMALIISGVIVIYAFSTAKA